MLINQTSQKGVKNIKKSILSIFLAVFFPKSLVGNKGFWKYLSLDRDTVSIKRQKIQDEERFDGKWVLRTNTSLTSEQVALKYKQLWQVEHVFRDMKSLLDPRPIFHKRDETIRGHVFCTWGQPAYNPLGLPSQWQA